MNINLITIQLLRHILTIILSLERYPQERIEAFCQAFIDGASLDPISIPYQAMIDDLELVSLPFHEIMTSTKVDKQDKGRDVKKVKSSEDSIKSGLKSLETKINGLTTDDQTVIEAYHLNEKHLFYTGKEDRRISYFDQLLLGITNNPLLTTVVPSATILVNFGKALYSKKTVSGAKVTSDVTNKKILIDPIKDVLYLNYLEACKLNKDNLTKVGDLFKVAIMDEVVAIPGHLYKGEYDVSVPAGTIINDPRIEFDYEYFMIVESKGLGDAKIFLSDVPDPTVIPGRAVTILAGETIEFPIHNIGSATEYYLIIAATSLTLDVSLKITIRKKK